jgi:hypothetical protein
VTRKTKELNHERLVTVILSRPLSERHVEHIFVSSMEQMGIIFGVVQEISLIEQIA